MYCLLVATTRRQYNGGRVFLLPRIPAPPVYLPPPKYTHPPQYTYSPADTYTDTDTE